MLTNNKSASTAVLVALLLLVGCPAHAPEPVDINASDMCAFCKMAISEKRYAAELVDSAHEPVKFDDIGCMLRHRRRMGIDNGVATFFVVDFDSRRWLEAASAYYVRAPDFNTPMSSGLVAYADAARAASAASAHHGAVLGFADLLREPSEDLRSK